MGSYSDLQIGVHSVSLGGQYESYDPGLLSLYFDDETTDGLHYETTAIVMRQRLALLGYSRAGATSVVETGWVERVNVEDKEWRGTPEQTIADWLDNYDLPDPDWGDFPNRSQMRFPGRWGYIWGEERRTVRYIIDRVPDDFPVTYDLSQVMGLNGLMKSPTLCADARNLERASSSQGLPTIVIAEGSTDVRVLNAGIELVRPHLRGFITFLDYGFGAQGSTSAVTTTIKAFAGAGVGNQVIALLDNDAAGRVAQKNIEAAKLPSHMNALLLPDLDFAKTYPAHGPEGTTLSDINGRAVSIELFMGKDVLKENGDYLPIQWTGLEASLNEYQGVIIAKKAIQQKFDNKVKVARTSGITPEQDWKDLGDLLDYIAASV